MRWTSKYTYDRIGAAEHPKEGDHRDARGFLWRRLTLRGETRWLEFAEWREEYRFHEVWDDPSFGNDGAGRWLKVGHWVPTWWYFRR